MPLSEMLAEVMRSAERPLTLLEIVHGIQVRLGLPDFRGNEPYARYTGCTRAEHYAEAKNVVAARRCQMAAVGVTIPAVVKALHVGDYAKVQRVVRKRSHGESFDVTVPAWRSV